MKGTNATREVMYQVQDHIGLPPDRVEDTAPQNTRAYEPLDSASDVACKLREFYAPHNRRLASLFGGDERFLWGTAAAEAAEEEDDGTSAGIGCRFVTLPEAPFDAGQEEQDVSAMAAEFQQYKVNATAMEEGPGGSA